jgi:Domain of unknown function (DUF5107)
MALLAALLSVTSTQPANASDGLEITGVTAPDNKTVEITFDRQLDPGLEQYVTANANAVRPFIRISGGSTGSSDAALDGRTLQAVNAQVFAVDKAGGTLRIVLPAATTLTPDGSYELWLDGAGATLDALRFRAADGTALEGTETDRFAFGGTGVAAALAAVESVEPLTSRLIRVTFASSILSGMPQHPYTTNPSRITIGNAPAGVRPVYVQPIAGSDARVFDLYLNGDLDAGESYVLQILGNPTGTQAASALRTTAGTAPPNQPIAGDGSFNGSATAHSVGIDSVDVSDDRTQLIVTFDHKISEIATLPTWMPGGTGNRPVLESPVTATTGDSLSAAELSTLLTVTGRLTPGQADPPGSGNPNAGPPAVDLTDELRHNAAYFADRQTLVVSLAEGNRLRRGSNGSVTLAPDSVVDVSGVSNGEAAQTVGYQAPNTAPPARSDLYDPSQSDYLDVDTEATTTFTHYDFTFAGGTNPPNYRVDAAGVSDRVVDEEINAIVVDNKYITATFTPEYGARLLSLIYKPTGNDLLYANPVGTPYGHGNNSPFYANWLMVWGGIAPTFSESEHGKYWFVPWDYEVTETADQVSITMTKVDTINHRQDGRFRYGATGLEIEVTYTVYADRPYVDMDIAVHNPASTAREYEYWTLTTLGPGRPLHEGSATMEHLAPLEKIRRDSAYTWMANVEERVNPDAPANSEAGRELYFDNMRYFSRWLTGTQTGGIAYGLDLADNPQGDWWGAVNHENSEGVLRVAPNDVTPGMKFWTWGFERSFDTNPYSRGNSARPYVEPWGGVSDRFFLPDVLGPGESKSWTETFLPTMDLHDVTNANTHGAAHVEFADDGTVSGWAFPTDLRGQSVFRARLVDADTGQVIASETFRGDAYTSVKLSGDAGSATTVQLVLERISGGPEVLLTAERSR